MSQWTVPSPEEIQQVTRDILSRPEFQPAFPWEEWFVIRSRQLQEVFDTFVAWLAGYAVPKGIVFALGTLLLVLLLGYVGRWLVADTRPLWRLIRPWRLAPARGQSVVKAPAADWHAAVHEVGRAISQGDSYGAIGLLHRGFLTALDQHGVLTCATWKTNTDYLRDCPHPSVAYDTLAAITRTYDQVVYAHQPVPLHVISTLLGQVDHAQRHLRS